jgi:hypothetical protein
VCNSPSALLFDIRCVPDEVGVVTAPCVVQWALDASGFAQGSACGATAVGEPVAWTNTSTAAAVIDVAHLVRAYQGNADNVQLQLYVGSAPRRARRLQQRCGHCTHCVVWSPSPLLHTQASLNHIPPPPPGHATPV